MPDNFPLLLPPFLRTPGINPNASVPMGDPYAELTAMLDRMQGQQFSLPQEGTLSTILNALAGGAAVLASPDPGGTLTNQMNQRQARKDKVAQINFDRQNNLDLLRINTAVEKARNITAEQQQFRKEQREQTYKDKDLGRELKLYGGKKDIDLASTEQGFRLEQKLLQEYQPLIDARVKNEVYMKDMPNQRKDSIEWQALARTALPNLDPMTAKIIGDKLSGLDRTPLTIEENDLVKKANQEINKQFQEERKSKLSVQGAQAFRDVQEGLYAQRNKPGQFQDRFANNFQSALGQAAGDRAFARFYYKNPTTGQVITDKEYNSIELTNPDKFSFKPLSPEENAAQRQIEVQRAMETKDAIETQQQQNTVGATEISPKAQQVLEYARQQNYTPEQTKVLLNSNGISIEEINKIVPPTSGQQSQFTHIPTPLLEYGQSQRPRQVNPMSPEEQKEFDALQKALEKERNKRRSKN